MNDPDRTAFQWASGQDESNRATDTAGDTGSGPGPSRRALLRSGVAVGTVAALGAVPGMPAGARTATRTVMFTGCAKDGAVTLADADTFEHIRSIDVYPDQDKEDALNDAVDQVEPVLLNTLVRDNYLEHANVSPDGRTLYAARGHVGDVIAVDIETGEKLWETELEGFRADHQLISSDGDYLYTSDLTMDQIDKIDTETGAIVARGMVRDLPHGIHYHRIPTLGSGEVLINGSLGNMLFPDATTGDPLEHQLTFMDPESMQVLRTVDFENGVRPMAVTHDGRKIYVQVSYFHGFHEYDTVEDRITRTKHLPKTEHVPEDERDYPAQSAHHGIGLSGDGKYICVAATTGWYVAIVRRRDLELVETIPVGEYPYWVQTTPDGVHAFVPVRRDNEVSVISYADQEEVARIPTGGHPHVVESEDVPEAIL